LITKEFVINALNFDEDKIALGFRNAARASYKISVKQIVNFSGVSNVYLHNKISNEYFDIKIVFRKLFYLLG
jgi:hypothetical protein